MSGFFMCNEAVISLAPSAALVYSFLSKVAGHTSRASWYSRKNIAKNCGISLSSVARALRELLSRGLISNTKCYDGRRQTTSVRTLIDEPQISMEQKEQPKSTKRTAMLKCDVRALKAGLTGTELRIYQYLSKRIGTGKSYLSKREVAGACRVSMATVYRAVKRLVKLRLLSIERQTRREIDGSNGTAENLYSLVSEETTERISPFVWLCVFLQTFFSCVTPSPISLVTHHRTTPIKKRYVNLKERIHLYTHMKESSPNLLENHAGPPDPAAKTKSLCNFIRGRLHFLSGFGSLFFPQRCKQSQPHTGSIDFRR